MARTARADDDGPRVRARVGRARVGLGYAVWYAVLPRLDRTRAAVVQLAVPVLAAAAGVIVLGEPVSVRLLGSSAAVLGGIALATLGAPAAPRLRAR